MTVTTEAGEGGGDAIRLEDFAARLRVAWSASGGRVWINRYGYLGDAKLDAIGSICR